MLNMMMKTATRMRGIRQAAASPARRKRLVTVMVLIMRRLLLRMALLMTMQAINADDANDGTILLL